MKKWLFLHLIFFLSNSVLAVEFTQITYESFKQDYLSDVGISDNDELLKAIIAVINNEEGKAVVWYSPSDASDIFSPIGKSVLIGFYKAVDTSKATCVTADKYECTGVKQRLTFGRIPTHFVLDLKVMFLDEALYRLGETEKIWYPFVEKLSEATKGQEVELKGLGWFRRHADDDTWAFQFSVDGW